MTQHIHFDTVSHPLGKLLVAVNDKGLCFLGIGAQAQDIGTYHPNAEYIHHPQAVAPYAQALLALWENPALPFPLPLDIHGTPFQRAVWKALLRIPCGQTLSYSELARAAGNPKAVRAAASACASNPIGLVIPCHRVVRKSGDLGGYAWGLEIKSALLRHEQSIGRTRVDADRMQAAA